MSVQRFSMEAPTGVIAVMAPYKYGNYVRYADHARIVAEMAAKHLLIERQWQEDEEAVLRTAFRDGVEQGKADAEQAHAAALAAVAAADAGGAMPGAGAGPAAAAATAAADGAPRGGTE